jgi:hypothetical protein
MTEPVYSSPRPAARFFAGIDALLRGPAAPQVPPEEPAPQPLARLLLIVLLFGAIYGSVMGAFGISVPGHAIQIAYGAVKVPMLLTVSFCLALPSFIVLNTLLGVRPDLPHVLRALLSMQAGLTVVLASLAPFTAFWYVSFSDYNVALLFNGGMFLVATLSAQRILRRSYRPLIQRNPRHRTLLRLWILLYSFVAIQMAWVLRPFLGDPTGPVTFFRREAWGNAYVELFHTALHALKLH